MGLSMGERKSVTRERVREYRRASRRQKGEILDQLASLNGWTRHYAGWMLRCWGRAVYCWQDGERVLITVGRRRPIQSRRRYYDQPVYVALKWIWECYGWMCGKRLVGVLRHQLAVLEKFGAISLEPEVRAKLERISAATVDRLLAEDKRQLYLRGRSHTKPSRRLLHEIPIRTFGEWKEARPGELGADLVGHDGGFGGGEHLFTLLVTDRVTQWTEMRAVLNKAQKWVFQALLWVRKEFPFEMRGLHTDCGTEFINHHLARYCGQEGIRFTRSRPQRKNDNNFTEQKNFEVVRKHVGYLRHESAREVEVLNQLYGVVRLLVNFCYPSQKLVEKTRQGARLRRKYDAAQTPYQRVLAAAEVPEAVKERLRRQFEELNPVALRLEAERLFERLRRLSAQREESTKDAG